MPLLILRWDDPRAQNPDLVGPKAANLASLAQAGFPVPAFFVAVPAEGDEPAQTLDALAPELPHLLDVLRSKGARTFAVRSSALAEDRDTGSLAGQFFSATGLRDQTQVLDAARSCLQSAASERVQAALGAGAPASRSTRTNILLQTTVEARWAGVAFAANPRPELTATLIEASAYSTDAVTAGREVAERVLVSSAPGRIPVAVGLVGEQPAPPPEDQETPDWLEIHRLARRARRVLGFEPHAADVEWAWDGRQVWILQARPGQQPPLPDWLAYPPDEVWTSFFFAERFLRPVSPLGWDLLRPVVEKRAFREPLLYLGHEKLARSRLTRLVNGRPYTRWSVFRKLHEPLSPEFLHAEKRLAFFPDGLPKLSWPKRLVKLAFAWLRVVEDPDWLPWANLRRWRFFVPNYVREVETLARAIDAHEHTEALLKDLDRAEHLSLALLALHRWSLTFAELFLRLLEWELQFGLGLTASEAHLRATELLRGLPGNLTTEMNRSLSELLRATGDKRDAKLQDFLRKYGHRSPSLDVAEPTWRERPDLLLRLANSLVGRKNGAVGIRAKSRAALLAAAARPCRLPHVLRPIWLSVFRWTLRLAEHFALLRENQRHFWHLVLEQKRRAALKIGTILQRRGLLHSAELIFELRRPELERVATGFSFARDLQATLEARRRQRLDQQDLPARLLWVETAADSTAELQSAAMAVLRGLGVSQGTGKGRVAMVRGESLPEVPEDSVLLLSGLDPGWTPLLGKLAGLITETGGALSHGAILAREFGVPAVTGVSGARQLLRDGDLVEVDGTRGLVRVLRRAGETEPRKPPHTP